MSIPVTKYADALKSDLIQVLNNHFQQLETLDYLTAREVDASVYSMLDNLCVAIKATIVKTFTIQAVAN
jgi:hypothetical protein